MSNQPLLSVQNLRIGFKQNKQLSEAVKGISFDVQAGETIGIVGESGSGKSVTSLSIMGLLDNSTAQISADKLDFQLNGDSVALLELPENKLRHFRGNEIAMIFQEPMTSLNPVYTCGNQVDEAIRLHLQLNNKAAKARTLELFEQVKLPDPERIYNAYPHELSGGQKQRVMIAMAISCTPKLLIADEPTTALDVTVQKHILELLADLQKSAGMGMIFITHDLGVVAEIADRIVVMYKGEIVEQGPVKSIFENPKHPYTKGLIACKPPLDHKPERLLTVADFLETKQRPQLKLISPAEDKQRLAQLQQHEPLLKVQNLQTWFPSKNNWLGKPTAFVKAVNDVSFNVYKGETLGLVGESGSGKTTLGRSILRLVEPNHGSITYDGIDFRALNRGELRKMRKRVQIIFQDPYASLNPRMTIGKTIKEPMTVHGLHANSKARREKTIELLEKVGLSAEVFNRYPHQFSGGQRQRICIARALALEPEFIICDESVSALDVSVQAQVLNLLNDLQAELGLTYIFISHDLSVVKYFSDQIIVMKQGEIVEYGAAREIYEYPKSSYTKTLISAIPQVKFGS